MHTVFTTLGVIPADADMMFHVEFILVGFGWVLGTLLVLCLATLLMGKIATPAKAVAPAPSQPSAAPMPSSVDTAQDAPIPPHHLAAIAAILQTHKIPRHHLLAISAAVHTTMSDTTRIVSVRPSSYGWAMEGRREHFASRPRR